MCLSTVYKLGNGEQPEQVCSNVTKVEVDGTTVKFTDLLGGEYELEGTITSVDLIESRIYVAA